MRNWIEIVETTTGWPEDIEPYDLARRIEKIHHTPEDLHDGDLTDLLYQFGRYYLQGIKVSSLPQGNARHPDLVSDYTAELTSGGTPPPIVYDSVNDRILDGNHRVEAAINAGHDSIMAYIGDVSTHTPL